MKSALGPAAFALAVVTVSPATAAWTLQLVQSSAGPYPNAVTVEILKETYLQCERAALAGAVSGGEAMTCSVIYEDLKRLGFDGDAARLRDWSAPYLGLPRLEDGV